MVIFYILLGMVALGSILLAFKVHRMAVRQEAEAEFYNRVNANKHTNTTSVATHEKTRQT